MAQFARRFLTLAAAVTLMFAASSALAEKRFVDSDDAKERDEPQKFLPDYDKLVKGSNADWVYFPDGGLTKYKTVSVKEFDHTGRGVECRDAAREGKDYAEQWLEKEGFKVVKSGGDFEVEGNVFNAWEPRGAARYWGGWAANPGAGLELLCKAGGKVVCEVRHKAKGSTPRDAVENGLEDMVKAVAKGK
ncbi:MAG: hypothetical protein WAU32_06965 [Thermoanaerobaculia bacterium]|jgi:hypothetical protein